ncbi:hypothetical protein WJX72_012445 [[Myrmecia] bisecta]|uniref:NADH dehydrogenase [ubiquinone] 1 beta subcomplex subunit 7 n=1 Tax=[Myrmecia] bisecta TaxID=41462 RepID=A0AAW1PZ19_9CHLO
MGKQTESRKFGAPLYCAAWPPGEFVYMAGGGGKKSSGIPNRIVIAKYHNRRISDEVGQFHTGEDAPLRMVSVPDGSALVLAMGSGGLLQVDIDSESKVPTLRAVTGATAERLKGLGMVKCMTFSQDGRLLALGGEDGSLQVLDWPSVRTRIDLRGEAGLEDSLRDVDFSPVHRNKVLATTCESGSCVLWHWEKGQQIAALELPAGLENGSFNRCSFARDGSMAFYTAINVRGDGYIVHWEQNALGELVAKRKLKVHTTAITAFDISSSGAYLGCGMSEGDVQIIAVSKLAPVRRVKSGHMIFVTGATFGADTDALLTVSADASARITSSGPGHQHTSYQDWPVGGMATHVSPPEMIATQEEMRNARLDLPSRDFCAHLLIPLNECRRKELYLPWKCQHERHAYEKCEYFEYKRRVQKIAMERAQQ